MLLCNIQGSIAVFATQYTLCNSFERTGTNWFETLFFISQRDERFV